jgi:hypothetical protein
VSDTSAPFDHLLITRFSVVFASNQPPAPEEWLYYRLVLFLDACYSSVVRQRDDPDFRWLVVLDDRCPDGFRADVEELAEGAFVPVWSHDVFDARLCTSLCAQHSNRPYLITTRLDSDDAIAVDFVSAVQRQFAYQEAVFVNLTRGIQIDRSGAVYRADQLSGPFLSLIERRREGRPPLTVFGAANHGRARSLAPVLEVVAPPMWVQVVHGTNVKNLVRGPRVSPRVVGERFDMDLHYRREVPLGPLLREKLRQRLRLFRLWVRDPGEAANVVEARLLRLRGTRLRPRGEPRRRERVRTARDRLRG